jgi:hypothetical protein
MTVYYYFLVPVKDKDIESISDPSLNSIRLNLNLYQSIRKHIPRVDDIEYFLLKGIEEPSVMMNVNKLRFLLTEKGSHWSSQDEIVAAVMSAFQFNSSSHEKYLAIAQYPLAVVRPDVKKLSIKFPESSSDVINHSFLHLIQFLAVKQFRDQIQSLESVVDISSSKYRSAVPTSAKFSTCCLNNLLVESRTKQISILKHECHRKECVRGKFDSNLYQAVNQILGT